MTSNSDRPIRIELTVHSGQRELLDGLEAWLQLGLISDERVRQICQKYLTCPLPENFPTSLSQGTGDTQLVQQVQYSRQAIAPSQVDELSEPHQAPTPNRLTRVLQSFMAEISVTWLLFLGVFLVVVSSGVLAVSQWQSVSPVGQYGILWVYTLAFWVAGTWVNRRGDLRLTARMLQVTTLLIIPINFWMIDGLTIWRSPLGWGLAAIAAMTLSAITAKLFSQFRDSTPTSVMRVATLNAIALSWLHWGWQESSMPMIATYVGTIGTAALGVRGWGAQGWGIRPQGDQGDQADQADSENRLSVSPIPSLTIAFLILLLIGRAILDAQTPVDQLGLAFGICGWLVCWLTRDLDNRGGWVLAGGSLLTLGWGVSVLATPPWQAIAISGLAMHLLADRLQRHQKPLALNALFWVGLQAVWLVWRLVPPEGQQTIIRACIQVAGDSFMPYALIGVGVFPYVLLTLGVAHYLRHQGHPALARQADILAFGLGGVLTLLSVANPLVRSLNLLLSTGALGWRLARRSSPSRFLIYLTHGLGVATVLSWIDARVPSLSLTAWAGILLIAVVGEWAACWGDLMRRQHPHPIATSAWHMGLGLAALSYALLLTDLPNQWTVMWLVVPAMLTGFALHPRFPKSRRAVWLSIIGLLAVQGLTLSHETARLISLGVATGLMGINTWVLSLSIAAVLDLGLGLGFIAALVWMLSDGQPSPELIVNLLAIAPGLLWLVWRRLAHRPSALATAFTTATNDWAIILSALCLLSLTGYDRLFQTDAAPRSLIELGSPISWEFLSASALITGAIACRWCHKITPLTLWGTAWGLDLLVAGLVAQIDVSIEYLAIAHLGLGLITQLVGDRWLWWLSRRETSKLEASRLEASVHGIPLVYAGIGLFLAHHDLSLTAFTGLYTLAASLICIGVGRRRSRLKIFTVLGIVFATLAAYELLVYQLLQADGGKIGDGGVLLAGLPLLIAVGDRLLMRVWRPYLRLSASDIRGVAHIHWMIGSVLLLLSLLLPMSTFGTTIWMLSAAIATGYALATANYVLRSGRQNRNLDAGDDDQGGAASVSSRSARWTYVGIVGLVMTLSRGLYWLAPDSSLLTEWGGAIAAGFAFIAYHLPWNRWGWLIKPWRRSASVLPGGVALITGFAIPIQGLLIVATFYAWLAKMTANTRLSYLSVALADWAVVRFLDQKDWLEPIGLGVVVGGSLLYLAHVDPYLRSPSEREKRHILRLLATSLICLTGFYQAEVSPWAGPLLIGVAVGFIFIGLSLQVRAFLYLGTATFVLEILRQVWRFVTDTPMLVWAIGIAIGLTFIWIAATFEARRGQVTGLMNYWMTKLDDWE